MTMKVKWATTWTTVNPGKAKIKWGTTWRPAGSIKGKWGGGFTNTGYVGIPLTPPEPTVAGHDYGDHSGGYYNTVTIRVIPPPVPEGTQRAVVIDHYILKFMGVHGYEIDRWNIQPDDRLAVVHSMEWDTRYQFAAMSVGTTGLTSGWSTNLRIDYGKPATIGQRKVTKTRAWSKTGNVDMYRDQREGVIVPTDVVCTEMAFDLRTTFATSYISKPGTNRELKLILQGNEQTGWVRDWPNPYRDTLNTQNMPGQNTLFGAILRDVGWTVFNQGSAYRVTGTITAKGNESYVDWEDYTIPGTKLSYW